MSLDLHASDRVVRGEQRKRVDGRGVATVLEHERRDDCCNGGYLAAGEAVVASALEPEIRVVGLVRSRAREDLLQCFGETAPSADESIACQKVFPNRSSPPSQTAP